MERRLREGGRYLPENKRYDRVKEITEQLEQGISELFNSERYKTWLTAMSRFHDYSLNNTLLIAFQKPDATLVAGYTTWKNQFGRQVRKGEKGIRILAPAPYKQKVKKEMLDPITNHPMTDADGKIMTETEEVLHPAFKVVNVFDVSQTEGRELPTLGVDELTGEVRNFASFFEALRRSCPVPVEFEEIHSGAKGYYHLTENRIAIQKGMSQLQTVKTAIHEMAHQKLHALDPETKEPVDKEKSINSREVEAESVAYTVCQRFGLDTSDYSFAYIAGWSRDKETPELKASLNTIRQAASEMIDSIEGQMKLLQKEKQAEKETASISFYVAECMEYPDLGEHHTGLTLKDAFRIYDQIPAERMNGIKGIGFELHDGSIFDGEFPLMEGGRIQKDSIELVQHFQESPLVKQAVRDCETILQEREIERGETVPGRIADPAERDAKRKSVLVDLKKKQGRLEAAKPAERQGRNRGKEIGDAR